MDENPYSSPNHAPDDTSRHDGVIADSRKLAVRRVRRAALIGIVLPATEYGVSIWHGIRHVNTVAQEAESDPELYSAVVSNFTKFLILQGVELVAAAIAGWWLVYPFFFGVCWAVRRLVVPRVPESEWRVACDNALWPLPYAATGGVITWTAYSHVFPYGWTNDIVCGTVGHILGAWCYLTILISWIKIARDTPKSHVG